MRIIAGDGPTPSDVLILGERPGVEEYEQGRPFVGPAGRELWARVWKILRLNRDDVYVTNLVKTFSTAPPTADEIRRDAARLRAELQKVRPQLIVTIGYHAARALLPQFVGKKGEFFHGLPFAYTYGKLTPRTAIVIPCCHSSAALRQPDRFQQQLTDDLREVKAALDAIADGGLVLPHGSHRPQPYRVGLAAFGRAGQILGVDTEGNKTHPECVTVARGAIEVACVETPDGAQSATPFLGASLHHAKALAIHYSFADVPTLKTLGITDLPPIHDTMLQAYLLGKPQGLKVLAYRELGYEMDAYLDLVQPLDDTLVQDTLAAQLGAWESAVELLQAKAVRIATKRAATTTVVNINDEYDVSIMRPGPWGNPFKIGRDGTRAQVIEKFRQHLIDDPKLRARGIKALRGKRLGCVCAPQPCHGYVWADVCNAHVRVTKKAIAAIFKRLHAKSDVPANRVISGLRRMLTTKDEISEDEE